MDSRELAIDLAHNHLSILRSSFKYYEIKEHSVLTLFSSNGEIALYSFLCDSDIRILCSLEQQLNLSIKFPI